ncbi:hypothetical protein TRFO_23489 [Tritrichomonas foetus]|uniref:B box-type domain-containing protein n=1 Tax=Tritrichomonas foetus TaxID=1144522 RepID=A0A1J4KA80_9EUKA|nr:hypothetical protein TRFO_23489 [Tritrichomonas foetus]|eukprot:OHT08123.1 hypothetical protein TRFO_23489 [Tritrichomonas foetus]
MTDEKRFKNLHLNNLLKRDNIRQLKETIDELMIEKGSDFFQNSYIHLLTLFESFMVEESNPNIIAYCSTWVSNAIFDFIPSICQSLICLIQTLRILPKIDSVSTKSPPVCIFNLFLSSIEFSSQQKQIIQLSTNYFTHLFQNLEFATSFIEENGFQIILNEIICKAVIPDVENFVDFVLDLVKIPESQSNSTIFAEFVSLFNSQRIPKENSYFAARFIAKIFRKFTFLNFDATLLFVNDGGLKVIAQIFKLINSRQVAQIISFFLTSLDFSTKKEPNLVFCHWLSQICFQMPLIQEIVFPLIIPYISNNTTQLKDINNEFPFSLWLTDFRRPLNEVIEIAYAVNQYCPEMTSNLLQYLLPITDSNYNDIFNIINEQLKTGYINTKKLAEFGFLETFVINIESSILTQLFCDNDFPEVTKQVFLHSSFCQPQVLLAILQSDIPFDVVSNFLISSPTVENIKAILADRSTQTCQLFLITFDQHVEVCENFIAAGGLEWLNEIDFSYFVPLLGSLVVQKRFPEVDDFILSLPSLHKLFSLPSSEIEKIVYGMNSTTPSPIRVPSLFHLIPAPKYIDPYNAYVLGDSSYVNNGYECPLITQIGNRYISPQHINQLLSRPYEIGRFCDLKFDHFPLFQFFKGCDSLQFDEQFKAVSFWFKYHNPCDTPVFSSGSVKLHLNFHTPTNTHTKSHSHVQTNVQSDSELYESYLVLSDDENYEKVKINPEIWNHVILYEEDSLRNNRICLKLNGVNEIHINKTKSLASTISSTLSSSSMMFKYASFEFLGSGLFFLGSAIRFYKTSYSDVNSLIRNGPGWINQEKSTDKIYTPYGFTKEAKSVPNNCYGVPYFGFPFHFISSKRMISLLTFLVNSRSQSQFDSIFEILLCINKIIANKADTFWTHMIRSMKDTSFVSKEILHKALESISGIKDNRSILSSILFDNDIWKYVNNELIVEVLFDEFKTTIWSNIPDFEVFMSTIVLQNPESQKIVDILLQNHEKIPNLITWVVSFLGSAHVLDSQVITWELILARSDSNVSHTILNSLIKFLNSHTVKKVARWINFENLCGLIAVSPKPLASHFFELMFSIESINPGYIEINDIIIYAIAPLAMFPAVWGYTSSLLETHNDKFLPLLLSLVWSTSLFLINSDNRNDERVMRIINNYEYGIKTCIYHISSILSSKKCMSILNHWFPLIFNFRVLFNIIIGNESMIDDIHLEISTLSDYGDTKSEGMSTNVATDTNNSYTQPCSCKNKVPEPSSPYHFMFDLILSIYSSIGSEIPHSNEFFDRISYDWLSKSTLLEFIAKLFLTASSSQFNSLLNSIFLSDPFFHHSCGSIFIPSITSKVLQQNPSSNHFLKVFLEYLIYAIAEKCFLDTGALLLNDLFRAFQKSCSCIDLFMTLFYGLISYCNPSTHCDIIEIITANISDFSSFVIKSNTSNAFLYTVYLFSKNNLANFSNFIQKMSNYLINQQNHYIITLIENKEIQNDHKVYYQLSKSFETCLSKFEDINKSIIKRMKNNHFTSEIMNLSRNVTKAKYKSNCHWYGEAREYQKRCKILDSTFLLIEEKMQWERFISAMHDESASESSFNPKCFHLSPRCLPMMPPQILTPSLFAPLVNKKKKKSHLSSSISAPIQFLGNGGQINKRRKTIVSRFNKSKKEDAQFSLIVPNSSRQISLEDTKYSESSFSSFDDGSDKIDESDKNLLFNSSEDNSLASDDFISQGNDEIDTNDSIIDKDCFYFEERPNAHTNYHNKNISRKNVNNSKLIGSHLNCAQNISSNYRPYSPNTIGRNNFINGDKKEIKSIDGEEDYIKIDMDDKSHSRWSVNLKGASILSPGSVPKRLASPQIHHAHKMIDDMNDTPNPSFFELGSNQVIQNSSVKVNCQRVKNIPPIPMPRKRRPSKDTSQNALYSNDDNYFTQKDNEHNRGKNSSISDEKLTDMFSEFEKTDHQDDNQNKKDVEKNIEIDDEKLINENGNANSTDNSNNDDDFPSKKFRSALIWQYRHHTNSLATSQDSSIIKPKDSFLSHFNNDQNCLFYTSGFLRRHELRIPSVIFVFSKTLLILTYSSLTEENDIELQPIIDNLSLHMFLESVFLRHWGETHLFASHIVIRVPVSSLICIKKIATQQNSIAFWSFKAGHFLLEISLNSFMKFTEFMVQARDNACSLLPESLIINDPSADKFILQKNLENGRTFCDLNAYPFYPGYPPYEKLFPSEIETSLMLSSVLPFSYINFHNKLKTRLETHLDDKSDPFETNMKIDSIPVNFAFTPEFHARDNFKGVSRRIMFSNIKYPKKSSQRRFTTDLRVLDSGDYENGVKQGEGNVSNEISKYINFRDALYDKENVRKWLKYHFNDDNYTPYNISHIGDIDLTHYCQQLNIKLAKDTIPQFIHNEGISFLPQLSSRVCSNSSIHVEKGSLTLILTHLTNKKTQFDHYFTFASSLDVSSNGLFLSIDFEFGLTRIWRIIYEDKHPISLRSLSDFNWSTKPASKISGMNFICASMFKNDVVLWEIMNGTVHRRLKFSTKVTSIAIDDEFGAVWVATVGIYYFITLNGQQLASMEFQNDVITVMTPIQLTFADPNRYVICGTETGEVFIATPRIKNGGIDIKKLPSQHGKAIKSIIIHPSRKSFLTVDEDGFVFNWTASGLLSQPLCFNFYECAHCKSSPKTFCQSCGRVVCHNCMKEADHQRMCIMCCAHHYFVI